MKFYEYLCAIQFQPLPNQEQVQFICDSIQDGLTVPFLARYRQPQTGGLQGNELRLVERIIKQHSALELLRSQCLKIVAENPENTKSWKKPILEATAESTLKEFVRLFGSKRKTLATEARDKGFEPLAKELLNRRSNESKKLTPNLLNNLALNKAMEYAAEIIIENYAADLELRKIVKYKIERFGKIRSKLKKDAKDDREKYRDYYAFESSLPRLKSYQFLALDRGSNEKILQVQIYPDDATRLINDLCRKLNLKYKAFDRYLSEVLEQAFKKKILPAVQRELMAQLKIKAHEDALQSFESNLQSLLLTPGLDKQKVVAIDPGFANGCKWACVDRTGNIEQVGVLMLQNSKHWDSQAAKILKLLSEVDAIAVGNGVGSHNCLDFIEFCRQRYKLVTPHLVVPEAGASVYSASDLANEELGDYKIELRGAISLGRRLFKPLEEYLKIPPMSLGVGMYQHDLNESVLHERLVNKAKDVLHEVGVDINQADTTSLELIAGIGKARAKSIINYRNEKGGFKNRKQLLNIAGFGPKSYEQAAGFCRVMESSEILDRTCVHPQDYADCKKLLYCISKQEISLSDYRQLLSQSIDWGDLSSKTAISIARLKHLKFCLIDYCLDPREGLPQPVLRDGIRKIEDLQQGEIIKGVIRNVVDFGLFIDLGIQQDGLLHRSCYPDRQFELKVKPGQSIQVIIKSVDAMRKRIALDLDTSVPFT